MVCSNIAVGLDSGYFSTPCPVNLDERKDGLLLLLEFEFLQ
jgi:hypothetical protein